jgi:hypothetical protein
MSPRLLRLLAVSYAVKTLLLAAAWAYIPDLPERALGAVRSVLVD